MPIYYTETEEEDPVFHIWTQCERGGAILEENMRTEAHGRHLCEDCLRLSAKKYEADRAKRGR